MFRNIFIGPAFWPPTLKNQCLRKIYNANNMVPLYISTYTISKHSALSRNIPTMVNDFTITTAFRGWATVNSLLAKVIKSLYCPQ